MSEHNKKEGRKSHLIKIILLLLVLAAVFWIFEKKASVFESLPSISKTDAKKTEMGVMMSRGTPSADSGKSNAQITETYDYEGKVLDVSGGVGSGIAKSGFIDGKYYLYAEFEHIPAPQKGHFYEGWIVRMLPFHFISTGKAEYSEGTYFNIYSSEEDLTDHDFYVLTIEPDDNDPRPADHVLEGRMKPVG